MNLNFIKKVLLILPFLIFAILSSLGVSQTAYVIFMAIWMIIWWIFELMPLGITALIPVVFLSLNGIMGTKEVLGFYAHPVIYLFLGGFIIAEGLEKTKLSERFAIFILRLTGKSAHGVLIGFIIATAGLSMWISNTATTVMMIPIADSILKFIDKYTDNTKEQMRTFSICILLSIAYAANIGGTMTPIGTPPNVVLMGYLNDLYNIQVDFAKWILIVAPASLCMLAIVYFITSYFLYPFEIELGDKFRQFLQNQKQVMGKINRAQKITLAIFGLTCLLWILKNPINSFFGNQLLNDTIIAILGGILLFMIPVEDNQTILDHKDISKLPWNIVLLFGGGMAMANSLDKVGVLEMISGVISSQNDISLYWFIFISSSLILFLTEVMSNVALCTVALPIFLTLAKNQGVDPLIVGIPLTLCSSYAFSMPISTPPNAIVFATGKLSIKHMLRAGILVNILGILITMTIGWSMMKLVL